jgi:hypothetical protein
MRSLGERPRSVTTVAGAVSYSRTVFECGACRGSFAPVDRMLGVLKGERLTSRVVEKAAYMAASEPFGQASAALEKLCQIKVSPAECARAANGEGARIHELIEDNEERWNEPLDARREPPAPEIPCARPVVMADAAAVLTVKGEEHKMVYCATAFDAAAREKTEGGRPFIAARRWAAGACSFEEFRPSLRALCHRMGAMNAGAGAFVGDGAPCLAKFCAEELPHFIFILDFYHPVDRLSKLLKLVRGDDPENAATLAAWKEALLESRLDDVLEELAAEKARRRSPEKQEAIQAEIDYMAARRAQMDYKRFKQEGWPIGSGAIEATCKHLVKQRFAVTGARWLRDNIKNVLALRLARFNEEWDSYWSTARSATA